MPREDWRDWGHAKVLFIEKELDKNNFICSKGGSLNDFEKLFAFRNIIRRTNSESMYAVNEVFPSRVLLLGPLLSTQSGSKIVAVDMKKL